MSYEVYLITNAVNGKQYVGITIHGAEQRFDRHKWETRKSGMHRKRAALHRAILKYGEDNFSVQTVHVAESFEEMVNLEQTYIAKYGTMAPNGYNLTTGGRYFKVAQTVLDRASARLKGKPMSEKNRAGLKRAWDDQKIRQRRCEAIKAAMNRPEVLEQTGARQRGKLKSASHIAALRLARARSVVCLTTGKQFEAVTDAVNWVRSDLGHSKATTAKICRACKSPDYSAYGHRWAYAA